LSLPEIRRQVPEELGQSPLDRILRAWLPDASWSRLRTAVQTGKVRVDGVVCQLPSTRLEPGAWVELHPNAPRPSSLERLNTDQLVHWDRDLVVVRKPAGVSTVPFEPGERGSLAELTRALLSRLGPAGRAESTLGVVQRLDRETSGLVVFARNLAAKRHLSQQFRQHSIERRYLALAWGKVQAVTLRSRLVQDRGDGRRGSTSHPKLGRLAVTHVRPLEQLGQATLVECRLETGRTHQIRIQLAEVGHPLYGERVYARARQLEALQATRLMLHAAVLGFVHPRTGERLRFEEPLPPDMLAELSRQRSRPSSQPGA
jgi:23S rRNA pseudouridine1911/1915/1917 synthase